MTTYSIIETSQLDGEPVELYRFSYTGIDYCHTSGDEVVVYDGHTYTPLPITRGSISPAADRGKSSLTLNVPRTFPLADVFRISPPSEVVNLTIYRRHRSVEAYEVYWSGRMTDMKLDSFGVEITCESLLASLQRSILTRQYSRGCAFLLYGTSCGVSKAANQVLSTTSAVTGNVVTSALAQAVGFFAGGTLEYNNAITGSQESRFVVDFSAGVFTLDRTAYGLLAGMNFSAYPGCDHSYDSCRDKFSNNARYGGFPNIPSKNPFSGVKIF